MKFVVLVTCALSGSCPLPGGSYSTTIVAKSEAACHQLANAVIRKFGYSPKSFVVRCQ